VLRGFGLVDLREYTGLFGRPSGISSCGLRASSFSLSPRRVSHAKRRWSLLFFAGSFGFGFKAPAPRQGTERLQRLGTKLKLKFTVASENYSESGLGQLPLWRSLRADDDDGQRDLHRPVGLRDDRHWPGDDPAVQEVHHEVDLDQRKGTATRRSPKHASVPPGAGGLPDFPFVRNSDCLPTPRRFGKNTQFVSSPHVRDFEMEIFAGNADAAGRRSDDEWATHTEVLNVSSYR
jgi:hypothetical protein